MFGNAANQLTTLLTGVPGFFLPNAAFLWGPEAAVGVEHAAMYSVDPLRKLLPELVDFDLVNSGKPRFTLGLVSVRSGQIRYFDSRDEKIGLDHVLGSSAVPPTFPAVRIDGEAYWDGGIYSNTPVEAVFDDYPRRSSVVFAVQIWHSRGVEPEIRGPGLCPSERHYVWQPIQEPHRGAGQASPLARHVVRTPVRAASDRADEKKHPRGPGARRLRLRNHHASAEINAEPLDGETNSREYVTFSPATIDARWQAGYVDDVPRHRAAAMGQSD